MACTSRVLPAPSVPADGGRARRQDLGQSGPQGGGGLLIGGINN